MCRGTCNCIMPSSTQIPFSISQQRCCWHWSNKKVLLCGIGPMPYFNVFSFPKEFLQRNAIGALSDPVVTKNALTTLPKPLQEPFRNQRFTPRIESGRFSKLDPAALSICARRSGRVALHSHPVCMMAFLFVIPGFSIPHPSDDWMHGTCGLDLFCEVINLGISKMGQGPIFQLIHSVNICKEPTTVSSSVKVRVYSSDQRNQSNSHMTDT